MSDALNTAYASNTETPQKMLMVECDAWSNPIYICSGFKDQVKNLASGTAVTFKAMNFDFVLPAKSKDGIKGMSFEFDKRTMSAATKLNKSINMGQRVKLTAMEYLPSLPSPQAVLVMYVSSFVESLYKDDKMTLSAKFEHNLLNTAFPRLHYNAKNTPGLINHGR